MPLLLQVTTVQFPALHWSPFPPRKAFLRSSPRGSRAGGLRETGVGGVPRGRDGVRGGQSGEVGTRGREGGQEWGKGREEESGRAVAGGPGSPASRVGSAVSMAVLGAARGKPTPALSPAVSSSFPLHPLLPPLPSDQPLLPSHLLFLPWRTRWAAGGRSHLTLPLHPEGRETPTCPGVPQLLPPTFL